MRVALNGTSLLSPLTGIGQYTYHLARGLQNTPGIELELFYGTHWSREIQAAALPGVASLKSLFFKVVPNAPAVSRMLRQHRFNAGMRKFVPDVYHEPNFIAFKTARPCVITVHDLSWIRFPEAHPVERVRMMTQFFEPALRRSNLVLTDSEFVKRELMEVFGTAAEHIVTVPLGVDAQFRPMSAQETAPVLARHDLTHRQYVLAVGTLEPRKNLQAVLTAFSRLPAELRRRYPLVVAGMSGWHTSAIEQQMAPLIRAGEVRQLGYVSRDDLVSIIAGAVTLVYPSIYEGFGLPPLEAMACGVPVIASDVSSLPEVVGDTGIQVHPHDIEAITRALETMIGDTALRDQMAARSLARSKMFTWDSCVANTISVYQRTIGGAAR
jgi:glycosyltransferase involved in cell wall biosynthesis